jgi:DHA1 family multidrug resistance protein-like MFS transporter
LNSSASNNLSKRKNLAALIVLLINTGLMWFGFFMLIPLLAVHITQGLMLGAGLAGLVLAVRQFVQQGLGPFAGPLADWVGYSRMMMFGNLVRAVGFAWMAVANEPFSLMMSGVVAALGGAGFEASGKASLAYYSKGFNRESVFSLSITFGNVGMALGPLVGSFLIKVDFSVVALVSASIYVFCFLTILLFVPEIKTGLETAKRPGPGVIFSKIGLVWQNRPFVILSSLLIGYYFLYVQINICLPLIAVKMTGQPDSVSLIFAINSGMAIFFQFFTVKFFSKMFKPITMIGIGTGLATIGLFSISFAPDYTILIVCVIVFATGRLLVDPVVFSVTSRYATEETMASYFGFSSLALAFGGMFGNLFGGWLYETGESIGFPAFCWVVFGIVGGLVTLGVFGFKLWDERRKAQKVVPSQIFAASPAPEDN